MLQNLNNRILFSFTIILIVILCYVFNIDKFFHLRNYEQSAKNTPNMNYTNFISNIDSLNNESIIIFVRFTDFSCGICFQEFINISKKIVNMKDFSNGNVKYYFEQDDKSYSVQYRYLKRWCMNNHIDIDFSLVDSMPVKKSCIIIKNNNNVYKPYYLPLGESVYSSILQKIDSIYVDLSIKK